MSLSEEKKAKIMDAIRRISDAVSELSYECSFCDDDTVNEFISEFYPFSMSLDEMGLEIGKWHDSVLKKLVGDSEMVLNRNTKQLLSVGDLLKFSDTEVYRVVGLFYGVGSQMSISAQMLGTGQMLRCEPSSNFYGAKIIKA